MRTDYYVDCNATEQGDGTQEHPWQTLDQALKAIPDENCTVWLAPGLYEGESDVAREFTKNVLIKSLVPNEVVLESLKVLGHAGHIQLVNLTIGRFITL